MSFKYIIITIFTIFAISCGVDRDTESDRKETLDVIHSRKSVRSFTDQAVDREKLVEIVKAGMAAPSGMDRRPWEFIIVEDTATLNKLAEGLPYAKMLTNSPAAIIVCGNMDKDLGGSFYWYLDCSAASQNILLAVEAMGLGATWTAAYPYEDRMKVVSDVLNLPEHIGALCVIPIGYPTGVETPKNKYNADKIHINKW